ncbi:methyltransferase family protein [Lentzea atacamensis]|uniref:Methyltransferase family protein n=1 Tax=Lentzea atacamensis TaxID=531938 RepID=A0ABX9EMM2_9PSEU|nr:class I SAM-dependent methyltransferase [Lentzea atacamensis]RAS71108.1 methyltransferase family protein [Lentzea atacamensis]
MTPLQILEEICTEAIAAHLPFENPAPQYRWLLDRWNAITGPSGRRPTPPGLEFEEAYDDLGFPPRMARFHRQALAKLPQLLRAELPVQQLLFHDGDVLAALAAYQTNVFTDRLNQQIADNIPQGATVLELGGGAGLTTAKALRSGYLFTDVSTVFTRAAEQKFGVQTAILDINEDFAERADVVIAGNVLHNATHIGKTLERIHRAADLLLFTESTKDSAVTLTGMQFLLGPPTTRERIFLTADEWRAELTAAGFDTEPSSPDESGQQLFVARRSA